MSKFRFARLNGSVYPHWTFFRPRFPYRTARNKPDKVPTAFYMCAEATHASIVADTSYCCYWLLSTTVYLLAQRLPSLPKSCFLEAHHHNKRYPTIRLSAADFKIFISVESHCSSVTPTEFRISCQSTVNFIKYMLFCSAVIGLCEVISSTDIHVHY